MVFYMLCSPCYALIMSSIVRVEKQAHMVFYMLYSPCYALIMSSIVRVDLTVMSLPQTWSQLRPGVTKQSSGQREFYHQTSSQG